MPDGNADVLLPGGKYNLSDVAARIGLSQLKQLDGFNEQAAGSWWRATSSD